MRVPWRSHINTTGREFFQVALITYLGLTLAETMKEGFVSNFFNMNYLLLVVLVTGLGMVLTEPPESELRRAVESVAAGVAQASRVVQKRHLRPAVDTVRAFGAAKVIDLRDRDTRPPTSADRPPRHFG